MTLSLLHAFNSAVADSGNAALVQPSNWNAEHTIVMATAKVLGRATAGTGAVEELATTGTGSVVLATAPTIAGGGITGLTGLAIRDTSAAFDVTLAAVSSAALTAGRTLTLNMGNVAHIVSFGTTAGTGSGIIFPNTASDTVAMLGVANVFTAAQTVSVSGALSAPGGTLSGTWITGGSATTTKPYVLIEPTGTTSTGWSTSGTGLGINAASGFAGNLLDLQIAGTSKVAYTSGTLTIIGGTAAGSGTPLILQPSDWQSGRPWIGFKNISNGTWQIVLWDGSTTAGNLQIGPATTIQNPLTVSSTLTAVGVTSSAAIKSSAATSGIGYATGAGGAVTQATNKSTGVTLNTVTGQITMNNANLGGQTEVSFTLTNSAIAATDAVIVSIASGATANSYIASVSAVAAGSCSIQLANVTLATTLGEAVVLNFAVIKGVAS